MEENNNNNKNDDKENVNKDKENKSNKDLKKHVAKEKVEKDFNHHDDNKKRKKSNLDDGNINKKRKSSISASDPIDNNDNNTEMQEIITNTSLATVNYFRSFLKLDQSLKDIENSQKIREIFIDNKLLLNKIKDVKSSKEDFKFTKKDIPECVSKFKELLNFVIMLERNHF